MPQTSEIEVILTNKTKLIKKFGPEGFGLIQNGINNLTKSINKAGIDSVVLYVDDNNTYEQYIPKLIDTQKPKKIKELIDVIQSEEKGKYINVLILGGDQIIPFFKLKYSILAEQPRDIYKKHFPKDDYYIYSDNPYASPDDDIFILERGVGRFPDGDSKDPSLLFTQIQNSIEYRELINKNVDGIFNYCSKEWKPQSQQVVKNIKIARKKLLTCPPESDATISKNNFGKKSNGIFNFHGSKNGRVWSGSEGGKWKAAFAPANVNSEYQHNVLYSEACYGTYINGKRSDTSICLSFLKNKVICYYGPTCICYGDDPGEPPNCADLLCIEFFNCVKGKEPFGKAVNNSKRRYIEKKLQQADESDTDIIDPYDKKTLLEYVLYADPTLSW